MAEPLQVNKSLLARMLAGDPALDWASFTSEDWRLIVQRAIAGDVAPQLYFALIKSGGMAYIPRREQKHLRAIYVSTRMKNEQSLCELERLAGLFEQAGIPVVALKGSCYALTVYTDIGLRPMVDVDLLVPASVLEEAMQIVWNSGYREVLPE
ncbi:MAG: nucleotidyltransferase family protein, partial [Syntrophothermus sp.]